MLIVIYRRPWWIIFDVKILRDHTTNEREKERTQEADREGDRGIAVKLAESLAGAAEPAARWVGKDALKELTIPKVLRRLDA